MADLTLDAPQSEAITAGLLAAIGGDVADTPTPPTEPVTTPPAADPPAATAPATPPADPPAPAPAPEKSAREIELEERLARLEASYNGNLSQKDAELQRLRQAEQAVREQQAEATKAAEAAKEAAWKDEVAKWEDAYRRIPEGDGRQAARVWIDAQIKDHEATQKAAAAEALRQRVEPVQQQLAMQQVMGQLDQAARHTVAQFQTDGAQALANTYQLPVEEIRQYLQRDDVSQRLQRAYLTTTMYGTTALTDYAAEIGERFAAIAARRQAEEATEIDANRAALAPASRDTAGTGAGAPKREISKMGDVTTDDWLAKLEMAG